MQLTRETVLLCVNMTEGKGTIIALDERITDENLSLGFMQLAQQATKLLLEGYSLSWCPNIEEARNCVTAIQEATTGIDLDGLDGLDSDSLGRS